jgi:thiosulfate/3-mercaptopyruvate sulfurtransferase
MTMILRALAIALLLAAPLAGTGEARVPPLVDTAWLAQRLTAPELVVLDIRNPFGGADRDTFEIGHVPGAVYSNFLTDDWHDRHSPAPATLPPVAQLEALLGRLGIGNDSLVVIVHSGTDSSDFSTAARAYWILKLLGHRRMAILDGGFRAWEAAGLAVEGGWNTPRPTRFRARVRNGILADSRDVDLARQRGALLVDARARAYYEGRSRAPVVAKAGTIPGAVNLEHRRLVDPETGRFVGREALEALLGEAGIAPGGEVITFCNIGHWSAAVWFALSEIAGYGQVRLYDGSMAEWAASPERPVVLPSAAERP